jgi:LruC domain-containing protein
MAGSFTVSYTLSGGLQNQQVAVKPGPDVLVKSFSIADFESVMNCAGTGCNNQGGPFVNKFPHSGFGTLAFEDLWPSKGDFDFNDLVIDYQFEITSNASNFIEKVDATFIIRAFGAAYQNGFGFQLSNSINASDLTVTGTVLTENYITLSTNGTEAGQNAPTIIVFDNAYGIMDHPGHGAIGVNTELGIPFVEPETVSIRINFPPNKYTWNDLDIVNFNPFLIVDMERGREIHLPGYMPTALANPSFFGRNDDATNIAQGKTYVTSNNLPWAIHIFETFAYPIERQDVIWVHLKFVEWAESGGEAFADWYKNKSGYRNQALIYKRP